MTSALKIRCKKMDKKVEHKIIPEQKKGMQTGASSEVEADTKAEAVKIFQRARQRLLDINNWQEFAGEGGAEFRLTNIRGNVVHRAPQVGDLVRIDLPGPGPKAGDGYDWVRIEAIEDNSDPQAEFESCAFRTRPFKHPLKPDDEVKHFYTDEATSSFVVERLGNKVRAYEAGRNEKANTEASEVYDKVRNAMVATGARMGISIIQWKALVTGFLKE